MKKLLLLSGLLIIIVLIFTIMFLMMRSDTNPMAPLWGSSQEDTPTQLPLSNSGDPAQDVPVSDGSSDRTPAPDGKMPVETQNGYVYVNDISTLQNSVEVSTGQYKIDPYDVYDYDPEFDIVYFESNDSFAISLRREPLSENRRQVEAYLQQQLGITQAEMCELRVYIGTSFDVNPEYSGQDFGFSFCPGSVQLQ